MVGDAAAAPSFPPTIMSPTIAVPTPAPPRVPEPPMRMPSLSGERPGMIDYGLLGGLAVIWGSSFMLQELVLPELPPAVIASIRLVSAFVSLALLALVVGWRMRLDARGWAMAALAGLLGSTLPFYLIAWGQDGIDAGPAAILLGLMPLVTLVLGHFVTDDERITPSRLSGVLAGLVGLVVLIGPASLVGLGGAGDELVRQGAVLLASVCYAVNVFVTRALSDAPRYPMVAAIAGFAALFMVPPTLLATDLSALSPSASTWAICIMLGVVHTALTTVMMFALVRRQGGNFFGLINLLVPLTGVAWAFALLGERPGWNAWIALVLIVGGVAWSRRAPPPTAGNDATAAPAARRSA